MDASPIDARVRAGRARVRRDYADGNLSAADWTGFRDELSGEQAAAEAEVARLTASTAEVERDSSALDAEAELLTRLAALRAAIAGEVNDAEGTDAVRAALGRLFERFVLQPAQGGQHHHDDQPGAPFAPLLPATDGYLIEVHVRPEALAFTEDGKLVLGGAYLRREPLYQAKNNHSVGSATR